LLACACGTPVTSETGLCTNPACDAANVPNPDATHARPRYLVQVDDDTLILTPATTPKAAIVRSIADLPDELFETSDEVVIRVRLFADADLLDPRP
jgi:hypothetical protein